MPNAVIHIVRGVPVSRCFRTHVSIGERDGVIIITVHGAATFTNYRGLKGHLAAIPRDAKVTVDFANTRVHPRAARIRRATAALP